MKATLRTQVSLCSLTSLAAAAAFALGGCAAAKPHAHAPVASAAIAAPSAPAANVADPGAPAFTDAASPSLGKNPGDFVVTEISLGGQRNMTLTQKALGDGSFEYSLKEGAKVETYRVRMRGDDAVSAVKVEGGVERPSTVAAYDAMMQRTVPTVDRNDGEIDTRPVVVEWAGKTADATLTRYKVSVGGKDATMSVTRCDRFAFGDVAGEITGAGGKLVYRARVVDAGSGSGATATASK